jgi:AcrR family transcriptional regulator
VIPATTRNKKSSVERWALPAQQERSRETRTRIFAAAEEVFADKGYEGARLTDIAKIAGCSVGAVYFRFKDKDALFRAIAESYADESRRGFELFVESVKGTDPHKIIRNFVTAVVMNLSRHRGMLRAIVERGLDHPGVMNTIFTFRDELATALEKVLSTRKADGLKIRVMTQMIYGFVVTGVLNKHAPTRIEDERAIQELGSACVAYFANVR